MGHVFVSISPDDPYEKVYLYNARGRKVRQVLWGDWLSLAEDEDLTDGQSDSSTWLWVRWGWSSPDPEKRQLLKIKRKYTASARPLEIIFVDVGIGDGAVLITPERDMGEGAVAENSEERIIVIDAGKESHMRDFLDSRFKAYRRGFNFHAAVVTHPDSDHYYGFNKIVSTSKITFDTLYHNGIAELNSADNFDRLGGTREAGGTTYLDSIITDDATMRQTFDPAHGRTNWYAKVIGKGISKENVGSFEMLGVNVGPAEDGRFWMPGFAPSDGRPYTIEVLGPWVERPFGDDTPTLRTFDNSVGKTKNGHSVLLRLEYKNFTVLFGGDLNKPSEMFLLQKLAGLDAWPSTDAGKDAMVAAASARLSSHVMKSCHHGSSDVTDEFIKAVRPAAYVISSGDQDANYVHPRPDLLGRLGRLGWGNAPVLLSTELQRSTRDIDNSDLVRKLSKKIRELVSDTAQGTIDAEERTEKLDDLLEDFGGLALPSVAVDGAIYVKTDGETLITAFKKETQDAKSKWFYYAYRIAGDGELELVPMEGGH